ncbi:MAG: hypothetical protein PUP91_39145 [Rhizonema sp. PD37]|nr:hypothetical protein [Rhizonema sp. PD37]
MIILKQTAIAIAHSNYRCGGIKFWQCVDALSGEAARMRRFPSPRRLC